MHSPENLGGIAKAQTETVHKMSHADKESGRRRDKKKDFIPKRGKDKFIVHTVDDNEHLKVIDNKSARDEQEIENNTTGKRIDLVIQ